MRTPLGRRPVTAAVLLAVTALTATACSSSSSTLSDVTKVELLPADAAAGGGRSVAVTVKNGTSSPQSYGVTVNVNAKKDAVLTTATVTIPNVPAGQSATAQAPVQGGERIKADAKKGDGFIPEDDVVLAVQQPVQRTAG